MLADLLWGVISGAVLGMLGRWFAPGKQGISIPITVLVGILAGTLGGLLADWLNIGETKGVDWIRYLIQIGLAMLGVIIAANITGRRKASTDNGR